MIKKLVAVLALGTLALSGCSSSSGTTAGTLPPTTTAPITPTYTGSITVLAAASLTGAFGTLKTKFIADHPGASISLSFGASSTLATQIINGAPGDVFASASTRNMTSVIQAKDAVKPSNFAKNVMEIAVPPSNPAKITQLSDLAKSGVKVVLCQPQVPCGSTAKMVFAKARIKVKPVSTEADVKSTLAKVTTGEADAGVVYVTDVLAAGAKVKGIVIPTAVNASTEYPIVVLKASKNAPLAQAFVDYVESAAGQAILAQAGFEKP